MKRFNPKCSETGMTEDQAGEWVRAEEMRELLTQAVENLKEIELGGYTDPFSQKQWRLTDTIKRFKDAAASLDTPG